MNATEEKTETFRVGLWQPVYEKKDGAWRLVSLARCCRCGRIFEGAIPPVKCPSCGEGDLTVKNPVVSSDPTDEE